MTFEKGDRVKIIDRRSEYYQKETEVVEVCGIRQRHYHLKIDGEEGDWKESQLKRVTSCVGTFG